MPSRNDDPYLVPKPSWKESPQDKVRRIASQANVPNDVANDYLSLTQIESGQNVNVRPSSKGARGFGQVMPDTPGGSVRTVGGRKYDLGDPDQNIEAGLRYFHEGGSDPVGRRLYYFGGPKAKQHYERTGQIPNISDGNLTAAQYVKATGGNRQAPQDPYLVPKQPESDSYLVTKSEAPAVTALPSAPKAKRQPAKVTRMVRPTPDVVSSDGPTNSFLGPQDRGSLITMPRISSVPENTVQALAEVGRRGPKPQPVRAKTVSQNLRQLDDPETARILRIQQQVAAEQSPFEKRMGIEPGAENSQLTRLRRTENEAVLERLAAEKNQESETVKQTAWEQTNKPEIDSQVAQYRSDIRRTGLTKWLTETQAKGASSLAEFMAGAANTVGATKAANTLRIRAVAAAQAAQEEGAGRTEASKFAQDILGGFAGSTPELLLMSAGVPPIAAFGAGGGIRAKGTGKPVIPAVTRGALSGAAFEIPAEASTIRGNLARAGSVGLGTAGVDLATGQPVEQALKSGSTNALMVGLPGVVGARIKGRAPEVATEAPRPASIAPIIAASRAERVQEATQGARPIELARAPEGAAEAIQQVRHVDLQARVKRGANAGDFKKETKAQASERRAKVEQGVPAQQPAESATASRSLLPNEGAGTQRVTTPSPNDDPYLVPKAEPEPLQSGGAKSVDQPTRSPLLSRIVDDGLTFEQVAQRYFPDVVAAAKRTKSPREFADRALTDAENANRMSQVRVSAAVLRKIGIQGFGDERWDLLRQVGASPLKDAVPKVAPSAEVEEKAFQLYRDFYHEANPNITEERRQKSWDQFRDNDPLAEFDPQRQKFIAQARTELKNAAAPPESVSPPKEPQIVKPYEMTREQIEQEFQRKKSEDDNLEARILGPELAKRYAQLQRSANSLYDNAKADHAQNEIEKIEASLSETDRNRLYGIGETGPQVDQLRDYRQSLGNLDDSSPQALAESMKWAVSRVGKETDPLKMNHEQQVAYGTLREAARIAHENGWDTQAISQDAVRAAGQRFSDPEDARFMLDRFLKKEQPTVPQRKQIAPSVSEGVKSPVTTPEIPQAASTSPLISGPRESTAANRAKVAADREARGEQPIPKPERKPDTVLMADAKAANAKDPTEPMRLVDQALNGKKTLSDTEVVQVDLHRQDLKNKYDAVNKELDSATDPERIAELSEQSDSMERDMRASEDAHATSNTATARALRAARVTVDQDFRQLTMVSRAIKARGRALTDIERETIKTQSKQIASLEAQLVEANDRVAAKQAAKAVDRIKRDVAKEARQAQRGAKKQTLDEEAAQIKQLLAQEWKRVGSQGIHGMAAVDPEGKMAGLVLKLAKNRLQANVGLNAEALVDEVHGLLKDAMDIDRRQVQDMISGYGRESKQKERAPEVKQLADIRSELKRLSAQEDIASGKRLSPKDRARQTQLKTQEAELTRRMAENDFSPKVRPKPVAYNRETLDLTKKVEEIKRTYSRANYKATRGRVGIITDHLAKDANIPKTIKSMGDISAVFRQGGFYAITHPIAGLAKPTAAMVRSFSEAGNRNVNNIIKADPDYETLRRGGTEFTGVDKDDPKLSHREEGYLGQDLINYVPVVGQVGKFSERTFTSFLDAQRLEVGKVMLRGLTDPGIIARTLGRVSPIKKGSTEYNAEVKSLSRLINVGTGRGSLGKYNNAAPFLNIFMFSPRLLASRVQLLNNMVNPVTMARMPKAARAQMIQDNVKFLAGTVAVMALAKAAGGTVNDDPDDADFLKIRFGSTTYDTLAGLQQPLRYIVNMTRAATGGDTYAGKDAADMSKRFARSKLNPAISPIVDAIAGSDFEGRKFSLKRELIGSREKLYTDSIVSPLPAQDFVAAMQKEGLLWGAIKASPTLTGVGVQTYDQPPEKAKTHAEKLARKLKPKGGDDPRTDEEIENSKVMSTIRLRSRQGENVTPEVERMVQSRQITERQGQGILRSARQTRLVEDFKSLPLEEAEKVYRVASSSEQEQLRPIIIHKRAKKIEDEGGPRAPRMPEEPRLPRISLQARP